MPLVPRQAVMRYDMISEVVSMGGKLDIKRLGNVCRIRLAFFLELGRIRLVFPIVLFLLLPPLSLRKQDRHHHVQWERGVCTRRHALHAAVFESDSMFRLFQRIQVQRLECLLKIIDQCVLLQFLKSPWRSAQRLFRCEGSLSLCQGKNAFVFLQFLMRTWQSNNDDFDVKDICVLDRMKTNGSNYGF